METECKHCGSECGYYVVTTMKGKGASFYNFDGSLSDNTEMHDCLSYHEQKSKFCVECHKYLGRRKTGE